MFQKKFSGLGFCQAAAVLCIALLAAPAFAQDEGRGAFDLGEIVVSAQAQAGAAPAAVSEVTAADFERLGVKTVTDALKLLPGVHVTVGTKDEPTIMIRGFSQDKVLILIDGIPLKDVYYNQLNLGQFAVDSIAKIKVTRGVSSPLYGPNGMGGVIEITTKKPTGKLSGYLTTGIGENNEGWEEFSIGAKSKRFYYSLSTSHHETDGFKLPFGYKGSTSTPATGYEDGGRRLNSDFNRNNYSAKIGSLTPRGDEYAIALTQVKSEKGVPIHAYNPTTPNKYSRYARFTDWQSQDIDLLAKQNVSKNTTFREMLYAHYFDNTYESFANTNFSPTAYFDALTTTGNRANISIYDDESVGMRILSETTFAGTHARRFAINYIKDTHTDKGNYTASWTNYETTTMSLGMDAGIPWGNRLVINTGVGIDSFEKDSATGFTDLGDTKISYAPQLGLNYTPAAGTTWRLSWGKKTQFPTQKQLFSSTTQPALDLNPAKNNITEIGLSHAYSNRTTIDVAFFNNSVRAWIDRPTATDPYHNYDRVVLTGFEMNVNKACDDVKSCWNFNYTATRGRDRVAGAPLANIAKNKFNLDMSFPSSHHLVYDFSSTYSSSRYSATAVNNYYQKPYLIMNAGISGRISIMEKTKWRLFITNLQDKLYQPEYGYPQEGRTFRFELTRGF